VTVNAPHETIEVEVRHGRIGRADWQLMCCKLGFVEANYVLRAAGVEVARQVGVERSRGWAPSSLASRLVDRYRPSSVPRRARHRHGHSVGS
jgi:hypothetical protein